MSAAYGVHALQTHSRTLSLVVNGEPRDYTPDVLVTWRKGYDYPYGFRQVWFEVKARDSLRSGIQEYRPLLKAARAALAGEGIGFRVVTERTFTPVRVANAEAMIERHSKQPDEQLYIAVRHAFGLNNWSLSLGRVVEALNKMGMQRYQAWDAIWFWIGWGYLKCDITKPVNDDTPARWWWTPPEGWAYDAPAVASRGACSSRG